ELLARRRLARYAPAGSCAAGSARAGAHADRARAQAALANLQDESPAKALAALREAVREQREAVRLAPRRPDYAALFGAYGAGLVEALMNTGDHAAASAGATELGRDLAAESPQWPRIGGFR